MGNSKLLWVAALTASAFLAACGGSDSPPPVTVASQDLTVATTASTVKSVSGSTFTFPAGVSSFGTTATTTLKVTAPATGTPTFNIASGGGIATGNMGFGSCIFTITASTIPSLPVGTVVTVDPCTIGVDTGGDPVGASGVQPVDITLGNTTSTPVSLTVAISATGAVTIVSADGQTVPSGSVGTSTVTGGS
jgi:hypothetical protein